MERTALPNTERLMVWSDSYDFPTPFTLFLDIIGWNDAHFGGKVADPMPDMGYLEISLLAQALMEYSLSPDDVHTFVTQTLFANQPELPLDMGGGS